MQKNRNFTQVQFRLFNVNQTNLYFLTWSISSFILLLVLLQNLISLQLTLILSVDLQNLYFLIRFYNIRTLSAYSFILLIVPLENLISLQLMLILSVYLQNLYSPIWRNLVYTRELNQLIAVHQTANQLPHIEVCYICRQVFILR